MALHVIPEGEDDDRHQRDENCPCRPAKTEGHADVGRGRNRHPYRGVIYTHASVPPIPPVTGGELDALIAAAAATPMVKLSDRISLPAAHLPHLATAEDPDSGPEAECGHVVVEVDGEWQHHDIPDDSAPHSASGECGCGPARVTVCGHVVYEHVDQDGERVDDLDYEGV